VARQRDLAGDLELTVDRRTFLKRGLFGGALLALGGVGLGLWPGQEIAAPLRSLKILEPKAFQVLVAAATRIVVAPGADPVQIAHTVDESLTYAVPEAKKDFNGLLLLLENALAGLVLDGRPVPFTRVGGEAQDEVLLAWRDSALTVRRCGYHALRKICLAAHWSQEASFASLPYAPPTGLNANAYPDSKWGAS